MQRRATRLLGHLKDMSYQERLKQLRLSSLEHRRQRGDIIEVFNYIRGDYDTEIPQFKSANTPHLRGHHLKLAKNRKSLNTRAIFFSQRVISCWNGLPGVTAFKSRLDEYWRHLPTVYDP